MRFNLIRISKSLLKAAHELSKKNVMNTPWLLTSGVIYRMATEFIRIDTIAPMEHHNMKKMITIVEFPLFLSQIEKSISTAERDELIDLLARCPEAGDEIPETGGIRKLRWRGKGKGKRGGLRVIYYFYDEITPLFLLTIYSKGVQEDLSPEQKRKITALAKILKAECKAVRKKYHD